MITERTYVREQILSCNSCFNAWCFILFRIIQQRIFQSITSYQISMYYIVNPDLGATMALSRAQHPFTQRVRILTQLKWPQNSLPNAFITPEVARLLKER